MTHEICTDNKTRYVCDIKFPIIWATSWKEIDYKSQCDGWLATFRIILIYGCHNKQWPKEGFTSLMQNVVNKPAHSYKSKNLDTCVSTIIEKLFTNDDVIVFVYDKIVRIELPQKIRKPYVIARSDNSTFMKIDKRRAYVIHLSGSEALQNTFAFLLNSTFWTSRQSNNAHFLIIINEKDRKNLSYIFQQIWSIYIYQFVVLTYFSESERYVEIHRGNPFHKENECGKIAKMVNSQFCHQNLSIKFDDRYWNLNKCPIIFLTYRKDYKRLAYVYHFKLFTDLAKVVNGKFISKYYNNKINTTNQYSLTMRLESGDSPVYEDGDISHTAINNYLLFVVRGGEIISPMKTLLKIYSTKVWISIVGACVTTAIALWIISSINTQTINFTQFEKHFFEVYLATLWGIFLTVPQRKKIRCIIICYLIYHIHIQTGFTSRLITVLTTPQYDAGITNLEELAEAKIPLFTHFRLQSYYSTNDNVSSTIYSKIKNKMQYFNYSSPQEVINKLEKENCGIMTLKFDLKLLDPKICERINCIDGTMVVGRYRLFYVLPAGNYFTTTFNKFLLYIEEFGITQKYFEEMFGVMPLITKDEGVVRLNLKHLFSVFVVLLFGWFVSIVVLIKEVVWSKCLRKYQTKRNRNF
ncbi:hypothetical protein FQR65_LT08051 [Abscondita terminalis]|nr:hypothetical protein FQR65_LT08051 [Abscondita terminalis]